MRISDWSSDVCSSDLHPRPAARRRGAGSAGRARPCGNVRTAWSASWARFWIRVRIWRRRPADASLFGLVAALFFAAVAVLVVSGRLDVAATGSHAHVAHPKSVGEGKEV